MTDPETPSVPGRPRGALLRRWGAFAGVALASLLLGLLVAWGGTRLASPGQALPGVQLAGRAVAELEANELEPWLAEQTRLRSEAAFELAVGEQSFRLRPSELGLSLPAEAEKSVVLGQGRSGNPIAQFGFFCARTLKQVALPFVVRLDGARFDARLSELEQKALRPLLLPSLRWDKELFFEPGHEGQRLDRRELGRLLRQRLERGEHGGRLVAPLLVEPLPVPGSEVEAQHQRAVRLFSRPVHLVTEDGAHTVELGKKSLGPALTSRVENGHFVALLELGAVGPSLKRFRRAVEKPARAASFDVDARIQLTVRAPEQGVRLDESELLSEIWAAAERPERRGTVHLRIEEPTGLTAEEAAGLGVKGLVAQFVTRHPCCEARVQNIHAVADKIDGLVLRPGEEFSLNRFLGPRSFDEGYVEAPTIVRGKMKATAGGGISQFATTLFNAVFDGGYEILQRQPHSIWFSRYPEGLEATVSYPSPDLIFRNDTPHGLLIKTRYDGTSIRVLLYGDNGGRKVERRVSARHDVVEPPLEYLPDPKLLPDEEELMTRGQSGWTVMTRRILHYPDGTTSEQGREVTYQPKPRVVAVHPCRIPEGAKGHTGEECPEPEEEPEADMESDAEADKAPESDAELDP